MIQVPFEADLIFNDFSRKRSIFKYFSKIVSEYDQKIPQSQTADKPMAGEEEPLNHHETPWRQTKQSNQLSLPHQDDCKTWMDIKSPTTKHRTITDSHNGSNNKQKVNNNRTTALEQTAA